jgi:hypothetical protein
MDTIGIDRMTGQMMSREEMRKRYYSPMALEILSNAGFFYNGVRGV